MSRYGGPSIVWLGEEQCTERALVGGKAAALALLARRGMPVPNGFCLTTVGFRRALDAEGELPADVWAEAARAFRRLRSPIAVRSSAISEDGREASFAGQHKTVLGVRTAEELRQAIGRCYRSLFSRRATHYRRQMGLPLDLAMAVLVQEMVEPQASGVAFSAAPTGGDHEVVLVEAIAGRGAELVEGQAQPERWRVERATGRAKRLGGPAVLEPSGAVRVAKLALQAEAAFGEPQDVEWALADGLLWLVQSRPVTSLQRPPTTEEVAREERERLARLAEQSPGALRVWTSYNVAEILPRPSPLASALAREALSFSGTLGRVLEELGVWFDDKLRAEPCLVQIAGRPYVDLRQMAAAVGLPWLGASPSRR